MTRPNKAFWRDKRVLVTGHTGFKGAWLAIWLARLGARVYGLSLPPLTTPNLFSLANLDNTIESHICDIRNKSQLKQLVIQINPEIVFHLAAQSLVRESFRQPIETFATNIMGTAHLLNSLRILNEVRVGVIVTTDKVYKNQEHPFPYREDDELGGYDPYSASKAASELVVASYRDSFLSEMGAALATARAGNVIGGGDWSQDRLIPDAIRAWTEGRTLKVRQPNAVRPWQHVLDPLAGYLNLAENLWLKSTFIGAWNFGPVTHEAATVKMVVDKARVAWGPGNVTYGASDNGMHEAKWLALETAKARTYLGFSPKWSLSQAITNTVNWYRKQAHGESAIALCEADIAAYEAEW